MPDILIIEDDIDIAAGIADFLERHGHSLDFAYNGQQALEMLRQGRYDLILLDVNLPYVNGIEVCKALAKDKITQVPVIIISANDTSDDILEGFEHGVWDYLVKPFHLPELLARINVALARAASKPEVRIKKMGLTLDFSAMELSYQYTAVPLHQTGFDLIWLLLDEAPGIVKSRDLYKALWGDHVPDSDPLRAHVYKLRQQFKVAFGTEIIETVRGVGYRIGNE